MREREGGGKERASGGGGGGGGIINTQWHSNQEQPCYLVQFPCRSAHVRGKVSGELDILC